MKLLHQPEGSSCCGQTCVAMVTDTTLPEVVAVIGKAGTHYTSLRKAAQAVSGGAVSFGPIIQGRKQQIPEQGTYIARVIWSRKPHASHFVVLQDNVVYDPDAWDSPIALDVWLTFERDYRKNPSLYLTSWVEVLRKDLTGTTN